MKDKEYLLLRADKFQDNGSGTKWIICHRGESCDGFLEIIITEGFKKWVWSVQHNNLSFQIGQFQKDVDKRNIDTQKAELLDLLQEVFKDVNKVYEEKQLIVIP